MIHLQKRSRHFLLFILTIALFPALSSAIEIRSGFVKSEKPPLLWRWSVGFSAGQGSTFGNWFEPSDPGFAWQGSVNCCLSRDNGLRLHFGSSAHHSLAPVPVYNIDGQFLGIGMADASWQISRATLGFFWLVSFDRSIERHNYLYVDIGLGVMNARISGDRGEFNGQPIRIQSTFNETYPLLDLSAGIVYEFAGPLAVELGGDFSLAGVRGAFTFDTKDDVDAGFLGVRAGLIYHFDLRNEK